MTPDDAALVAEPDASADASRLVDLEVLYRLADAIGRAATLEETLDEALAALTGALGLERAAVLLADADGAMRFQASRGLSAAFREAAEGYAPWPRDAREPLPVVVGDVAAERTLFPLREPILAEGIRSLAFVPLVHRGRLLGELVLSRGEPGVWSERETRLAQAIATHVAAAAERLRALAELEESRRHLEVVLRDVADGITVQDRQGRLVYANDAAARTLGFESGSELLAVGAAAVLERFELVDENGEPLPLERLPGREALAGIPEPERLVGYREKGGGDQRWSLVRATPVLGDDGQVELAINVFHDVTARRRAQEAAAFLSEAGVVLASSLDYETTLASVARLAVPRVADWCIVYMREEDGSIRRLALEHSGGRADDVAAVLNRFPLEPEAPTGVPAVIRTGEPLLLAEITAEELMADVDEPERLAVELEEIALSSYLCVPLIARGRTLGAIALLAGESRRRYGPGDLELASELARRAALAVDNARLFASVQQTVAVLDAQNETVVDGLLLVSPEGRIVTFNRRFAEIWGISDDVLADGSDAAALAVATERVVDPGAFMERVRYLYANPDTESRDEVRFRDGRVLERHGKAVRGADGSYYGYLWSFRDVTEQKRAEAALAASEERFRSLVGASTQIVWTTAADGSFVEPSTAWEAYTGQQPDHYLGPGWGWLEAIHEQDRERMAGAWRRAVADGEPVSGEYRLRRHDGQYRRVVVSAVPIRDAGGRIREWVGSHTDVEEERRATELTQTIAENAASALFMMDSRGHPTYMNSAATAMTGFTLDEIRGRPLHDSVHHTRPDGTPYPIEDCPIDRALLRERPVEPYEDVFLRKDGSFFPVRVAAAPITRDGVPAGTVIEVQDITAEQQAERELEARASAAEALEFVGEGILLVDSGGVVRLWNPAAAAITGLRAEDVEGRPAREAIPQWEEFASRVPTVTPADARVSSGETVPVELGGSELWLSATAVSFGSGTVYAFRDVTEERGLERLKSEFVSTISHELRTPLAAIYGAALTLRRSDLALSEELRRELLAVVADEADRLARIVNDILWTSRIESGGLHVRIEHCDARQLAGRVVSAAQTHLPDGFSIELHAGDGLPEVAVDADKVRQVLANLVDNAVKYSPDGGRIEVRVAAAGGRVRFAVSDEGLGVPLGERDRVFEKFYRLDPDLTRGVGGTGLGLYICRELVRRMDGWIWVEPKEPRGSVFVVDLPGVD